MEWQDIESDLIIIGVIGIKDPLRDGMREAVKSCNDTGVKVRIITGDNINTAITTSKEAGILESSWEPSDSDYTVMEGR